MDKINYSGKIKNFLLKIGSQNQDIAYEYLAKSQWDEEKAFIKYQEDTIKMNKYLSRYMKLKERKQKMKPKNINTYPTYEISSINSIFNKISSYFKEDNIKYYNHYFSKLKNSIQLLDTFISELKNNKKIGIIILYSKNQIKQLYEQFKKIINEPLSKELFFDNSIIYPAIDKSLEGSNLISELECEKLPAMSICKYKNDESLAIISNLYLPLDLQEFRDKIFESELSYSHSPKKDNQKIKNKKNDINTNNNINNNNLNGKKEYIPDYRDFEFDDDIDIMDKIEKNELNMTDGQFLAFQEMKVKELEKMEEQKIIEEKKIKENEDLIEKEIEESKKVAQNLKPEPKDDNPNKCIISFRYPDGEKTVERKFLKTDKISDLYDFIKSLGREIFTENDQHHFSLLQAFPRKVFDDLKDHTLESEGLFPNSVLQIKEID